MELSKGERQFWYYLYNASFYLGILGPFAVLAMGTQFMDNIWWGLGLATFVKNHPYIVTYILLQPLFLFVSINLTFVAYQKQLNPCTEKNGETVVA